MRKLEVIKNVCLFKYVVCNRGDIDCPMIPRTTDWQVYKKTAENITCPFEGDKLKISEHETKKRWVEDKNGN